MTDTDAKARKMLAAEYEADGLTLDADDIRSGNESVVLIEERRCLRAIAKALDAAGEREKRPIILKMAAADDAHQMWERRFHSLKQMYATDRWFADQDGQWGLRDFIDYAGQCCGFERGDIPDSVEGDGL